MKSIIILIMLMKAFSSKLLIKHSRKPTHNVLGIKHA